MEENGSYLLFIDTFAAIFLAQGHCGLRLSKYPLGVYKTFRKLIVCTSFCSCHTWSPMFHTQYTPEVYVYYTGV